jgi:hypothetical protein
VTRPRPTVRARLTLLYTVLFAACGAVVVAVSYAQVARLPVQGQVQGNGGQHPSAADLAWFAAQCRSEERSVHPDPAILAKCASYFQQQGARSSVTSPTRTFCSTR